MGEQKKSTDTAMHMDKFLSWKVDPRVLDLVQATCFKNFLKFEESKYKLNMPLLTAVMSFFDDKHMAFSFPAENFMVDFGLEDILYITGLPIDGRQVSGYESSDPVKTITENLTISEEKARRLSKERPTSKTFVISPELLQIEFEDVPKDIGEKELEPYFMAYLLFLLGTLVMPNKTKSISPMFLPLLQKAKVNKYAWGAAMLAVLKDSLCKWKKTFTGGKTTSLCGFAFALQVFALVRFTVFQQPSPSSFPVMVEWEKVYKPYTKNFAKGSLEHYQKMLQNMKEDEINWQPYSKIKLPAEYTSQWRMVFAQVPCICFNTIALNYSGTFFKQLGLEE